MKVHFSRHKFSATHAPTEHLRMGQGYSAVDIIGIIFKVTKNFDETAMPEGLKLAFIRQIGMPSHSCAQSDALSLTRCSVGCSLSAQSP